MGPLRAAALAEVAALQAGQLALGFAAAVGLLAAALWWAVALANSWRQIVAIAAAIAYSV